MIGARKFAFGGEPPEPEPTPGTVWTGPRPLKPGIMTAFPSPLSLSKHRMTIAAEQRPG